MCGSRLNRSLPLPPATRKRHPWSRRAMPIPSPYRPCKPPACWLYQTVIPVGSTGAVVGSPSVPKISVSGTSIFEEIQPRRYWVCEPSFSEGFRNRLRRPTSAEPHPNGRHWASQCGPAPGHFGLGLCPRGGGKFKAAVQAHGQPRRRMATAVRPAAAVCLAAELWLGATAPACASGWQSAAAEALISWAVGSARKPW
jgi:hypothetical protein